MTTWRATFDALEAGASAGNAEATAALEWISATIQSAFDLAARRPKMPKLDGADSCEHVAEALAVWIKESAPRAFADMTGTRYSVTGIDCSAEGMERLRDQSEFILIAYPGEPDNDSPDSILAQWIADLDAVMRPDGFDFEQAEHAIREYHAEIVESGYLPELISRAASYRDGCNESGLPADDWDGFEESPFRLYVRDNAPEPDASGTESGR